MPIGVMLLRDGREIALGEAAAILTPERLERLYGTPIETVRDGEGRVAFLPG